MITDIYKMKAIKAPSDIDLNEIDFFFFGCGKDDRSYEVLRSMLQKKIKIKHAIVCGYSSNKSCEKYDSYKDIINLICDNVSTIALSNNEELFEIGKKHFMGNRYKINSNSVLAIDTTTLKKPNLFFLLHYFKEVVKIKKVHALYTEPKKYVFPKSVFNSYSYLEGEYRFPPISGFTGSQLSRSSASSNEKKLLIIFLGFEGEVAQRVGTDEAPTQIILINGFPSYSPKIKDISILNNELLINTKTVDRHQVNATNPFEVYTLLQSICARYEEYAIEIVVLGTKPMMLGTCMYAMENRDIRVVYPSTKEHKEMTTEECGNMWHYEIPCN